MEVNDDINDKELMQMIANGDKTAFSMLMNRHIAVVLNFNKQYLSEEAEDITQEAFIRLWNKAPDWQDKGISPKAWLMRVSYNLCIDELRKRKTVLLEDTYPNLIDTQPTHEQTLVIQSDFQLQLSALNTLPERQRSAITLCAYNGLNNKQAAIVLNISADALESLLARGRRTLKKLLRKQQTMEEEFSND